MSINDEQNSKKKINSNIIIALITGIISIIVACIAFGGDMLPVAVNLITMNNQKAPSPTLIINGRTTVTPTSFIPTSSPAPSVNSNSGLTQECQGIEVYLVLNNLLTGIKRVGCLSDEKRLVILSSKDIDGLANLTGRISGSAISEGAVCHWQWYTNINSSPNILIKTVLFLLTSKTITLKRYT